MAWKPCDQYPPEACRPIAKDQPIKGYIYFEGASVEPRHTGTYAKRGLFLPNHLSWAIVTDDEGALVLVARPMNAPDTPSTPDSDWIDTDDDDPDPDDSDDDEPECDCPLCNPSEEDDDE